MQYRCQVCEDVASGFHYGVWSCEGCKAFFKRSLQGSAEYVCPATNSCTIDKLRRKSCQACRLRKCYECGMSASGNCKKETRPPKKTQLKRKMNETDFVKSTNATKSRKLESTTDVLFQQAVNNGTDAASGRTVPIILPEYPLDNTESIDEQRERACRLAEYLQRKTKVHMSGMEINFNSRSSLHRPVLLINTLKMIASCLVDVINWAKAIPGFSTLGLSSRVHLLVSGWSDVVVLDTVWRSLSMSDAVVVYPGFTMTRYLSDVLGCTSLYTRLLAIVETVKRLQLTFDEFVLLRCDTLLNADIEVLYTDMEVRQLRTKLDVAWHLLFDSSVSHHQRCMDFLLTLTHIRQCGVELSAWLSDVVNQVPHISVCNILLEMLGGQYEGQWKLCKN